MTKAKLIKIASLIERALPLVRAAEISRTEEAVPYVAPLYCTGSLNILVHNGKIKPIADNKKFANLKVVKSAKNLATQIDDFIINSYVQFTKTYIYKLSNLNCTTLLPLKSNMLDCTATAFEDFKNDVHDYYKTLFIDVFNVGRQHQLLSNPKAVSAHKFMTFTASENHKYESVLHVLTSEFNNKLDNLNILVVDQIDKSFNNNYNKKAALHSLDLILSDYSIDIGKLIMNHCWEMYSVGNLHQLIKDGTKTVMWQTGHYENDCQKCRAYEIGESIVCYAGKELPHAQDLYKVKYNLVDMNHLSSLAKYCHEGCRCILVAAD